MIFSKLLARKSSSNVEQEDMMDEVNGLSAMKKKADITDDLFGEVIAEKFIPFDYEVSIVGARFKNGEKTFLSCNA